MSYHTIRLNRADTLFSRYIREKRGWRCEKCGVLCRDKEGNRFRRLEASHYHGRGNLNTRYDVANVRTLCFLCHQRMGGHTRDENGEYDLWMKELLGPEGYKKLRIRAELYAKRDEKLALLYVKSLIL